MTRIQYQMFADVDERFGPRAFQGQIGEQISVTMPDGSSVEGKIANAVVAEGGLAVTLTLDLPEGTPNPFN